MTATKPATRDEGDARRDEAVRAPLRARGDARRRHHLGRVTQLNLFAEPSTLPDGMRYQRDLFDADEERDLMRRFAELPFRAFEFQGFIGKRRVASFGWRYDFNEGRAHPAEPVPDWLLPLRERAAAFAGLQPERFEQALVTEYEPGAAIGWHRDRPAFDRVLGLSFGSPCTFRLRRSRDKGWERRSLTLERRSVYLLSGEARAAWEHSIPPAEALRYSLTFRNLRSHDARGEPEGGPGPEMPEREGLATQVRKC